MKRQVVSIALLGLAACGTSKSAATFTCLNGPDMSIVYEEDTASLYFPDGRVELLPRPDPSRTNYYAKPGYSWSVGNREARLNDGRKSYLCDQMAG